MRATGAALAGLLLVGAAAPPRERVVTGDALVDVRVEGVSARLRIDPAAPAMPLIDRRLAERAGLKLTGSWGIGIGYAVGGTEVMSRTQVVRLNLGAGAAKRRVGWTSRPFATVADGSVGPEAFPEPVVRFQLRPARAGERTVSLPTDRDTALFGMLGNFSTTFARIDMGGQPMRVRFDPYHARTLATAGAGARLARHHDGVVSGEAKATEIFFGVERPVRTLTLRRPLALGPLSIGVLGLRTADYGSVAGIREADAAPVTPDPDEVVVTARGRKRDVRRDTISLGADALARCSSIVFDKPAKVIRLTCA